MSRDESMKIDKNDGEKMRKSMHTIWLASGSEFNMMELTAMTSILTNGQSISIDYWQPTPLECIICDEFGNMRTGMERALKIICDKYINIIEGMEITLNHMWEIYEYDSKNGTNSKLYVANVWICHLEWRWLKIVHQVLLLCLEIETNTVCLTNKYHYGIDNHSGNYMEDSTCSVMKKA